MKKMLLKCLSIFSLVVATSSAFAASSYETAVVPTSVALSNRAAILAHANSNGPIYGTYIVVVNHSYTTIRLAYPTPEQMITERTSGVIKDILHNDYTTVILRTEDGKQFWASNTVGPYDVVEVYVSNNEYVVHDTTP